METYKETHPWLKFYIDLRTASPKLWLLLGEAQSKCAHIAGVPLRPNTAEKLYQLYLAKGALATTAIEGNTLSEEEVLQHLEGKLKLPPSREYLAQEIDNILEGCNQILEEIRQGRQLALRPETIKALNKIVLNKLNLAAEVIPGESRKHQVGVARYKGAPAGECELLLQRLCDWLNGENFKAPQNMEIVYAILKAVLSHLYLAWIHPFDDGNGRTARLVEFQILISSGVPAPAAHLFSNHYNQTRTEYYRQLDYASQSGGDILPFIEYAVQGFVDGLKSQLERIRDQQWDVVWRNYVHESFRDKTSLGDVRRRHLILDLSLTEGPIPFDRLTEVSPRVAASYARKTTKTLSRDINELRLMGLLAKGKEGYRTRKEMILAFLPPKAERVQPEI
ncbi:MAG: Fic family protein [Chlamydiae bacterium]|nr:Fic family protein [Chlamydiota bacterium]MBI3277403.1 Fic family protein [Chlamydiota bacterium]